MKNASRQSIEVLSRANCIYADCLQRELEQNHLHEFVAIEPQSGEYFVAASRSEAIQAARQAHPDRPAAVLRIGHESTVHTGLMTR